MPAPTLASCLLLFPALLLGACGGAAPYDSSSTSTGAPDAPRRAGRPGDPRDASLNADQAAGDSPLVVFLGDSITAGYGLSEADAFPSLLRDDLASRGVRLRVVNAGVSGDTTFGALDRLQWFLDQRPAIVVVELGANDALRGTPLDRIEGRLREIVRRCRDAGASVILAGMRVPPNYGPEYSEGFHALFARVAADETASLVPFLLEGVAGEPSLNLPDGIHPTAEGHRRVAALLSPYLEKSLKAAAGKTGDSSPR